MRIDTPNKNGAGNGGNACGFMVASGSAVPDLGVRRHYTLNINNAMGWIADLLKEIPSAARYKSELEQLLSEHEITKTEKAALQAKNEVLIAQVEAAQREIQRLTVPSHQKQYQDRPEIEQRILLMLAGVEFMAAEEIAKRIAVGQHVADHHLDKLEAAEMIWAEKATYGAPICWQLMSPGRDYLIERGLLK